jgi:integrase
MSEKVNERVLQKQTGHKSLKMLEHYGNHNVNEDMEIIRNAQIESFGKIIQEYEGSGLD